MDVITNFGRNVRFEPDTIERPQSDADVLALLERHAGRRIRVLGSRHSWSRILVGDDVAVDLGALDSIVYRPPTAGRGAEVEVGGGCTIERLLRVLDSDHAATLPAIGGVTRQTIAGAIATGTHGSGQHSISHHVLSVDVAVIERGRPTIERLSGGDALRAARCHLGRMGIVTKVRLACARRTFVEERVVRHDAIEDVLAMRESEPLQYFVWLPFDWRFVAFHRHVAGCPPSLGTRIAAAARRAFTYVAVDHGFHLFVTLADRWLQRPAVLAWLYRLATPVLLLRRRPTVDRSDRVLTLAHHLYRHVELEVAIPADRIADAARLVRHVTEVFAGESPAPPDDVARALAAAGLDEELAQHRGKYTLGYPMSFRFVREDDTLLSQSSDGPVYTVSFFSYAKDRTRFDGYTAFMTRCLVAAFDGRPHFGKLFHVGGADVARLYGPKRDAFLREAGRVDPDGTFVNEFTAQAIGGSAQATSQGDASDR